MTKIEKAREIVQGKLDKNLALIKRLQRENKHLEFETNIHNPAKMKKMSMYVYKQSMKKIRQNNKRIADLGEHNAAYKKVLSVFVSLRVNEDYV